jgi:hypothetical protein
VNWKLWEVPFQTEFNLLLKGMGNRMKFRALEKKIEGGNESECVHRDVGSGKLEERVQVKLYVNIESCQTAQAQVKNDWWRPGSNGHQSPMREGVLGSAKTVIAIIIISVVDSIFTFLPPIHTLKVHSSHLSCIQNSLFWKEKLYVIEMI